MDQQADRGYDQQSDDEGSSKLFMGAVVIGDQEKVEQQDGKESFKPEPSAAPMSGLLLEASLEI
jgi:hypothetical protein